MTTKTYTAQYNVFDNDNGNDVYIMPKQGKTLNISAAGINFHDYKIISSISDLPAPNFGVITLEDNTSYLITSNIDIGSDRIVCGTNTNISGTMTELASITSTTTDYLITSTKTFSAFDISFYAPKVFSLKASVINQVIYLRACNAYGTFGLINDYILCMFTDCYFYGSGLIFDKTLSTIGLQNCIFHNIDNLTTIKLQSTATITTRINICNTSFVTDGIGISLDISASATIPSSSYILNNCNFSGTTNTHITGLTYSNNKSEFIGCLGVPNSRSIGNQYLTAAVGTSCVLNTWIKLAMQTTVSTNSQRFSQLLNGQIQYTGAITQTFIVVYSVGLFGNVSDYIRLGVIKNTESAPVTDSISRNRVDGNSNIDFMTRTFFIQLEYMDYLALFIYNETGSNLTTANNTSISIVGQF